MASIFADNFSDIKLSSHGVRLPEFIADDEQKKRFGTNGNLINSAFLRELSLDGITRLSLDKHPDPEDIKKYSDRLEYELGIIQELGYVDYILLVWDVVNFCARSDIPTGLGRGSAAGSLVLYCIGVTKIDPIKYGLYFERFISKARAKKQVVDGVTYIDGSLAPDVDLDICYYSRHKVLTYLEKKFLGSTAKILTLNTLSGRLVMKECGKVIGDKSEEEMGGVSSLIPKVFGQIKSLEETHAEIPEFKDWCDKNERIYDIALKISGLIKNKSVHPSGILLSYAPLEESCPTELTSDKEIVSSYDMNWVSLLNVKLDALGLRSVSVVDDACKLVGIKVEDIDLSDPIIYQSLYDLRFPHGLFQIEADTNFMVCQKVRPKNLEELSAVLALARPGALAFVDQYALFTNTGTTNSIHPFFDSILAVSGGVCLYQEQMMQMAHKIGFTLDEAEILRRIVGKKKVEEAKAWKQKITSKISENGLAVEIGEVLWKVLEDSANYSFNKSHSVAYSALAASTVYLKFKHPREFFLALLKMTRHEPDPIGEISKIHKEMHNFGIELLPPNLVKSDMDFKIEGNGIRFGLLSIKGIAEKSMEKVFNFKKDYSSKLEVFQSAKDAGLSVGILSALIQAGALAGLYKESRSKVVYEAQLWNLLTEREKMWAMKLKEKHSDNLVAIVKDLQAMKDEKGKGIFKDSRMETLRKSAEPYRDIYNKNSVSESFANWYYEKRLLGYSYAETLRAIFRSKISGLIPMNELMGDETPVGSQVIFIGYISEEPKRGTSRSEKKTKYGRFKVADESGSCTVLIFSDKLDVCEEMNGGLPKEENIVIVKGRRMGDAVFADSIAVQDNKVYTRLSELKD